VTEDRRLSRAARRTIERSQSDDALWLSLISLWEVAKKVEKGQLTLDRPVGDWLDVATVQPGLRLAELTRAILVASCQLAKPCPGDPADQIIIATARACEGVLITKDHALRRSSEVRTLW
jgi:PIN domain nuclease of toxin-antitoxin system